MSAIAPATAEMTTTGIFPMPILRYRLPDCENLNDRLKKMIYAEYQPGVRGAKSARAGSWHSENKSPEEWNDAAMVSLISVITDALAKITCEIVPEPTERHFQGWRFETWANVNPKGAYNDSHDHGRAIWSGTYYIDVGDSRGGEFVFEDRSQAPVEILNDQNPYKRDLAIQPNAGELVIFPGKMLHRVEPNHGDKERITIAFNAYHPGYVVPSYRANKPPNWRWKYFLGPMLLIRKAERLIGAAK